MILTIYIIILIYFLLGAIGFYFINRRKELMTARKNRVKFITYFFLIHTLFFSIVFSSSAFHYISIVIILVGIIEAVWLFRKSGYRNKVFFAISLLLLLVFCSAFLKFSRMDKGMILFTFLVLSVFDAFSQISGQLAGNIRIFPAISPGKTLEGLTGGAMIAIFSSLLLRELIGSPLPETLLLAAGIVISAFIGDMAASFYKRKYGVKDFSNLLPGHGGFMDRFDSLIAGGAFIVLLRLIGLE
jgi:phosphatidate cytidylyltransferase